MILYHLIVYAVTLYYVVTLHAMISSYALVRLPGAAEPHARRGNLAELLAMYEGCSIAWYSIAYHTIQYYSRL